MLSGPDLANLIAYARVCGAKIILAGDLSQLQAVENGGGMSARHPWAVCPAAQGPLPPSGQRAS